MDDAELARRWGPPSLLYDPGLLAGFRPRPTDVLLGCASKSGTTWMQAHEGRFRSLFPERPPSFRAGGFVRKGRPGAPLELSPAEAIREAEAIRAAAVARLDPEGVEAFGLVRERGLP